jgi:molybdate transport system ATP-binding protein
MTAGLHARLDVRHPGFNLEVEFELPGNGVSALFGPSGSGKTTCLRALAGLERSRTGRVSVNGETWQDEDRGVFLPTHRRGVAYVFQEASLLPHLSVRGNLEYGQRRSAERSDRAGFDKIAALFGIEPLLDRQPAKLSGGERQRVAMARALLMRPRLLLLDEPLAAVDQARKGEVLPYLERMRDELQVPAIYVSHNADEVARLADYIVLLDHGRVVASGPLLATLSRLDLPLAFLRDASVVLDATVVADDAGDHLARLEFAGGALYVPSREHPIGQRVRCRIDARDVSLTLERQEDTSILNLLPATVVEVADAGHPATLLVRLDARGSPLLANITQRSWRALALEPGKSVWAQIKAVALIE